MPTVPVLDWRDVAREYTSFLAAFLTIGAAGFRYAVLRPLLARGATAASSIWRRAADRAAWIGTVGGGLTAAVLFLDLDAAAVKKGLSLAQVVAAGDAMLGARLVLATVVLFTYLLAALRVRGAWPVAALAALALVLRNVARLQWTAVVNPLHVAAGGLWIGTLLVMVAAGIPAALGGVMPRDDRGHAVAEMVRAFSPLALSAASLLVASGGVTAVRHLKRVDALWTTPYGVTFLVKLVLVVLVFTLGAWNWRRVRPSLGSEPTARRIWRSASAELAVAVLVLVVTAVLVSLPSPR